MATTVEEGFRVFLARLTPSPTESEKAKRHRASIEDCLKRRFGITRFFRTGSFGSGTSIRGHSDVDYFASIPREKLKADSNATLRAVRNALAARFSYTAVTIKSPAVFVPFGTTRSESTEVVPAYFVGRANGYAAYEIPDGAGGWMVTSPEAHNAYVAAVDATLGSEVRPLVRFVKAWKCYNRVPVSSFYLELWVASYASGGDSIVYSVDVTNVLRGLSASSLAAIQDPMGISGYIYPGLTAVQRTATLTKLSRAVTRAEKALDAEQDEKTRNAFYWWNLVFGERFPAYG